MPKITRHGGPSVHVGGIAVSAAWGDEPQTETAGAVTEPPASTAPAPTVEEDACPGSSSETSSETPPPSSEPSESATPSRARKTASRSKRARTASSSAPLTDGDLTDDPSAPTTD